MISKISKFLAEIKKLLSDQSYLNSILSDGAKEANELSEKNINEIKKLLNFIPNDFYLPIAEIEINLLLILFFGFVVGFMSGLFGVGGGLMTPLLIFMGIPPSTAVGTESVQILGSSVSGAIAHSRKKNIDYEIGIFLLIGVNFWVDNWCYTFNFLKESGNIDLIINILYVIFLSIIGTLMLIESTISLVNTKKKTLKKKKKKFS